MTVEQAIEELKNGSEITYASHDTGVFYKMCHGDVISVLNAGVCVNGITAQVDAVLTIEDFLNQCRYIRNESFFKIYDL